MKPQLVALVAAGLVSGPALAGPGQGAPQDVPPAATVGREEVAPLVRVVPQAAAPVAAQPGIAQGPVVLGPVVANAPRPVAKPWAPSEAGAQSGDTQGDAVVVAQADAATADGAVEPVFERRIPGAQAEPGMPDEPVYIDPNSVPPPSPRLPGEFIAVPDRWRLIETLGVVKENYLDPYNQNTLKGDRPLFDDWFLVLAGISDTIAEPRAFPIEVGIQSTDRPDTLDLFGETNQFLFATTNIVSIGFIKGDTAYKPPDYEFRFVGAYQYNYFETEEERVVRIYPGAGTSRSDNHLAVVEAFVDYHIRNVSDRYDFDSIRVGIQPFSSDFRGFLFQDAQLGVRLFGTRANNRFQYNIGAFKLVEKDTNSGLNDVTKPLRHNEFYVANLYWQDFPVLGFTSQATVLHNRSNEESLYVNNNGFVERPARIGDSRGREYNVTYLGLNGDGHFGRLNLTYSLYYAFGKDNHDQLRSVEVGPDQDGANISAWFFAAEPSYDMDWIRIRGSFLYSSGDDDPLDGQHNGFDSIFENPQFAGADTSYWMRQTLPLIGGGGALLTTRNGIIPSLRTSKEEGQSNFVNPGLWLIGAGFDADILPELRLSANANYLQFDQTEVLELLRNEGDIDREIGWDLSAALIYRPLFTQNVVFRLSGAILVPGDGLYDLYNFRPNGDNLLYSVLANVVLNY
ncbi:hypothetical protein [Zavarzinia sp. CC-PAN008]|uniref:hypothetical protein n=1 Tax=Zavarzinia sp. CC-PAN008 TaxID=3243332 RepID=UPI003F746E55